MSATNRGSERSESDYYPTPVTAYAPMLELVIKKFNHNLAIFDPCCGDGRIVHDATKLGFLAFGQDVNGLVCGNGLSHLNGQGVDYLKRTDWYLEPNSIAQYILALTNPPFSEAQEFISHSLNLFSHVCMMTRLNFLASKKRKQWWQENKPDAIFIISERPSFGATCKFCKKTKEIDDTVRYFFPGMIAGQKCPNCGERFQASSTDATDYCWLWWGSGFSGLHWI